MSSSTALLPKPKKDDHPIFLRVCHSPWISINQQVLMFTRGVIALYMTVTFFMLMYFEDKRTDHGWLMPFELQNVTYLIQVIYFDTTFIWTFMHLYYPNQRDSTANNCPALLSPPKQDPNTKNRTFFSIFYTASLVFPALVTFGYWIILTPHDHNGKSEHKDVFHNGWFQTFCILNAYAINTVIALVEVLALSSIRRMEPVYAHVSALTFLAVAYIGWTFIGHVCTDKFVYYFLDYHKIGWEYVLSAVIAFCGLTNGFFTVVYGLTGFREMITKHSEDKSYGYNRIPQ